MRRKRDRKSDQVELSVFETAHLFRIYDDDVLVGGLGVWLEDNLGQ